MEEADPRGSFHYLKSPDFSNDLEFIRPLHISAIGEILEDGLVCAALKIEFSAVVEPGLFKPSYFQVPGRKVIRTCVNDSGTRKEAGREGRYLFLELLVNTLPDSNEARENSGSYRFSPGGGEWAMELPMLIPVRQTVTIFCGDGRKIAPFNRINDTQYIEYADDFIQQAYEDEGLRIQYNIYIPGGYEKKSPELENLPLVFFLHGAGESGFDNRSPLSSYRQAQEYLRPQAWSEQPCFLMIPQCPVTSERDGGMSEEYGWYTYRKNGDKLCTYPSKSLHTAIEALTAVMPRYNIDSERIYAAGHSMGGGGALAALIDRPEIFAAALSFSSAAVLSDEMIIPWKNKPVFFTMSEKDEWDIIRNNMPVLMDQLERLGVGVYRSTGSGAWDGALRGAEAEKQAEETIAAAEATGSSKIYAEFITGSVTPLEHLSHRASFSNAAIRRWLFRQRLASSAGAGI
ncbi:MAG: prolyl oligopeptidase family serine peptidase [Treponema sp.]|nr:prolyl oligopeptidase family serine peptidase [Treponema sp.]